jgi:hypothetical protein
MSGGKMNRIPLIIVQDTTFDLVTAPITTVISKL